ncbi:MAG: hypothetical protein ACRDO8_07175 [Nocardioidaceae bacterium]
MDDEDIPPISTANDPIGSQHDLHLRWRALMGPLGFSERLLWLGFIGADACMAPGLTQIAELPQYPDDEMLDSLMEACRRLLDDPVTGGSVAFLLSRPGTWQMTGADRAWARGLLSAARRADVPIEPVHLANDHRLCVFAPDDLAVRAGA